MFESFQGKEDAINKLKGFGKSILAAGAIFSVSACDNEKSSSIDHGISDNSGEVSVSENESILDHGALNNYFQNVKEGNFPSDKYENLAKARAISLALLKNIEVKKDSIITMKLVGGVPVEISIDGNMVPLSTEDFQPEELKMIGVAKSIMNDSSNGTQQEEVQVPEFKIDQDNLKNF